MGKLNIPEDEPIENFIITKSLENAQAKIEGFNFDARKHVLEYDDVLNQQRTIVYERRRRILAAEGGELKAILDEVILHEEVLPEQKKIIEGRSALVGEAPFYAALKRLFLQSIDMFWIEHLEAMEYMRGSVSLRAYGQRDPLVEYKREGVRLFKEMQSSVLENIMRLIPAIGEGAFTEEEQRMRDVARRAVQIGGATSSVSSSSAKQSSSNSLPIVGRNDPCPCGSGKKYKRCHGA